MNGWTEYDLAKLELQLREARLNKMAMTPTRVRQPIHSVLAGTLVTLANRLAIKQRSTGSSTSLVSSGTET